MAQEGKTEKATPRRRQEQRKEGRVAKSQDVALVGSLFVVFVSIRFFVPYAISFVRDYYSHIVANLSSLSDAGLFGQRDFLFKALFCFFVSAMPIVFIAALGGVLWSGVQTRFLFSWKAVSFKFSNLNPLNGFKNMFSLKSFVKLLFTCVKMLIVGFLLYKDYLKSAQSFVKLIDVDLLSGAQFLGKEIVRIVFNLCMALSGIALIDYLYTWWTFEKSIMMTKQEIKDEYKQLEGNPQIKGQIRRRQRQIAQARMMQMVPKADVVIRNPTHCAVALKYEQGKDAAPKVIAKGQDVMALKIIAIAEENKVLVTENRELAWFLYRKVKIDKAIPAAAYKIVAEIFVWVYTMKERRLQPDQYV
ncbi:MAG: flagellar biosynthesis protein FlhB [Oscillospiraceae bacterium]|jgi:flagellar biosynthetic protein FlhB|nr:flagellar biosynthesis protein FlhB [Oscillospiraceae bacterium]